MSGGGGQRGPTSVAKGTPPKFAEEQIVPPKAPPLWNLRFILSRRLRFSRM